MRKERREKGDKRRENTDETNIREKRDERRAEGEERTEKREENKI